MLELNVITQIHFYERVKSPYTTPSTVNEVSAMFVATINRLQFGGGGLNTRTCRGRANMKHHMQGSESLKVAKSAAENRNR